MANTRLEAARFDRWLSTVKAEAWAEGYRESCRDHGGYGGCATGDHGQGHANPYRKGADQ